MKKLALLAIVLLASLVIVSCATTTDAVEQIPSDLIVETVPAEPTEVSVITETVEQEVVAQPDTIVIDTSMSITADDPEIEQKFSYVYGHLLGDGIASQDLPVVSRFFIAGSTDFFNYVDPVIDEYAINDLFVRYQSYLDGAITLQELEATELEPAGDMKTFYELFSYGYGFVVQYNIQNQGILVDLESFNNGIADAFGEVPLAYSDEQIDAIFLAYQENLMRNYYAMLDEFAAENLADAEAFLAENAEAEGVMTTDSGLQYKVVSLGDGPLPTAHATVELDYMMTFLDGTTGDSSYARGEPTVFNLANLIPGFSEGVQLMPVGSHFRFYVHPSIGYREEGSQTIPPNTLLIFDVELHAIVTE